MTPARQRSLKALTLLRKANLDRQAGQLFALRGIEAQIQSGREANLARMAEAATATDLQVMPYMRDWLAQIGRDMVRLDAETVTVTREIANQQQAVTSAWRELRVVENITEADHRRAREQAQRVEEKAQDEHALSAHLRRARG